MRTTNPAKCKSMEVTEKVIFPDATEQVTKVEVHGADKHTNVTRELFLPAVSGHTDGTRVFDPINDHIAEIELADAQDQSFAVTFKVPDDFVSFTKVEAAWYNSPATAAGNMRWRLLATYGASGELYRTHSDSPAFGVTATANVQILNVQEPENPLTLANLAKGDYVGIRMIRTGTHADDTINESVYVHGLLFTYTAEQ